MLAFIVNGVNRLKLCNAVVLCLFYLVIKEGTSMKNTEKNNSDFPESPAINISFDKLPMEVYLLREEILAMKEILMRATTNNRPPTEPNRSINSVVDLAKFLGVSRSTAHYLMKSGRVKYVKYGRKLVVDPETLLASLNGYKPKKKKPKTMDQPAEKV